MPPRRRCRRHGPPSPRLWWGHPAIEQIIFWGLWNEVAGRDELDVGPWRDDRELSRHGASVFSLLNDRWRTETLGIADSDGFFFAQATHGDSVATWQEAGQAHHARFRVRAGAGPLHVALVPADSA